MAVLVGVAVADVVVPAVVPPCLVLPAVGVETRCNVPARRKLCVGGRWWRLWHEGVAQVMSVSGFRHSGGGFRAGPQVGVGLVGPLDLGEVEQPVLPVVNRSTRDPSQPNALPV